MEEASPAFAHQGGYYWRKADAERWFHENPMQPFGAYGGIVIHFQAVKCVGFNRQVPRESSPPTIHKGGASWYKQFTCVGLDRSGRTWTWFAHGHKMILEFSYLDC